MMLAMVALLATVAGVEAQQTPDPRVADIVRSGKVGLHLPQFFNVPVTGEIHGHATGTVIVPIAQALAARLGVELQLIGHPAPPALVECLNKLFRVADSHLVELEISDLHSITLRSNRYFRFGGTG